MRGERERAEDDNLKIYMDVVPGAASLPAIAPKLLVAAKAPDYLSRGRDKERWFADIVPDRVAKALSRYTEEMDVTVRGLLGRLEGATDDARLALAQHGLPEALDALSPQRRGDLPVDLRAAFQDEFVTQGGAQHLQARVEG